MAGSSPANAVFVALGKPHQVQGIASIRDIAGEGMAAAMDDLVGELIRKGLSPGP